MKRMIRTAASLSILAAAASACTQHMPGGVNPNPSPTATANNNGNQGGNTQQPGNPSPSVSPTATPDAGLNTTATLSGMVYNEMGSPVSGGKVMVKSLNAAKPFQAEAEIVSGAYVINGLPEGLLLQVIAMKDGWTSRSQTAVLVPTRDANKVNFGGAGNAYFITDYPEIEAVEPALDAQAIAPGKLVYKLQLSEALDDNNRRRLENALRVIPANAAANGGTAPTATQDLESSAIGADIALEAGATQLIGNYAIKKGSSFMGDANKRAKITWTPDGKAATLEFDAPLLQSKDTEAKYQVVLVSEGTRITDGGGKQLGTNATGSLDAYPTAGNMVFGAFKSAALRLNQANGTLAQIWDDTHENVGTFDLQKDETAPELMGIEVAPVNNGTRIELMFSEPMAAYFGTTGNSHASLADLSKYAFAVGATSDNIKDFKLDGTADVADVDPNATATYGASAERGKEFKFTGNQVVASVDPMEPKRVFLTIARPNFFNVEARDIKVRVEGVADPAGNAITKADADADAKLGAL
jgi:hypothetical protein